MKFFPTLDGLRRLAKAALMKSACFQRLTDQDQTQASVRTICFYQWTMKDEKISSRSASAIPL